MRILILFYFIALSACGPSRPTIAGEDVAGILDGTIAATEAAISHSAVRISFEDLQGRTLVCTGTLLAQDLVVTAGHCVTDRSDPTKKFTLPADHIKIILPGEGSAISAAKIVVNPLYLKYLSIGTDMVAAGAGFHGRDLALIKLASAMPPNYRPAQVSNKIQSAFQEKIFAAGFGHHSIDGSEGIDGNLRWGAISANPNDTSVDYFSLPGKTEDLTKGAPANTEFARMLEYSKKPGEGSLCHGDSGGPLYFEKGSVVNLVAVNTAIVSKHGLMCADLGEYQQASLLLNDNLQFLVDAFRSLEGQRLPGIVMIPSAQDPARFNYYFGRRETPSANSWVDLKALTAASCTGTPRVPAVYLDNTNAVAADDGSQIVTLRVLTLNDQQELLSQVDLEAHTRKTAEGLEVIVQTPSGFLRTVLTHFECTNP